MNSSCVVVVGVQIVDLDAEKGELVKVGAFDHHYPATKIMWGPVTRTKEHDMVATTGDYLRLWNIKDRPADADSADGFKVDVSLEKMLNPVGTRAGVHGCAERFWLAVRPARMACPVLLNVN